MKYKIFLFMCAPAELWQRIWAKILGCHFSTIESPPSISFGRLYPALLMFQRGEISIGKMTEVCAAWKQDKDFFLPDSTVRDAEK